MLAVDVEVVLRDLVRQQHGVLTPLVSPTVVRPLKDAPVDHEMGDVYVLWLQFTRQRLGQAAQPELADRERG